MNVQCSVTSCDNNTGFSHACAFGIDAKLIRQAKSGKNICPLLKTKVLELEKEFREVFESESEATNISKQK